MLPLRRINATQSLNDRLWFAVYTKPRAEKTVRDRLMRKDIEVFLPQNLKWYRKRGKRTAYQAPLFPGYLFVHVEPVNERYVPVLRTQGVVYMLKDTPNTSKPIPVPDSEIASLKIMVDSKLDIQAVPYVKRGDAVKIIDGPLAGCCGIVRCRKNATNLIVSVDLMQRSVSVRLKEEWLERVDLLNLALLKHQLGSEPR